MRLRSCHCTLQLSSCVGAYGARHMRHRRDPPAAVCAAGTAHGAALARRTRASIVKWCAGGGSTAVRRRLRRSGRSAHQPACPSVLYSSERVDRRGFGPGSLNFERSSNRAARPCVTSSISFLCSSVCSLLCALRLWSACQFPVSSSTKHQASLLVRGLGHPLPAPSGCAELA